MNWSLLNGASRRCETDRHMENMARGQGFTGVWLLNRSCCVAPLTEGQVLKVQGTGPGSQPGKEALGLSSDGSVTNAVLARATPLSFVCLLESDLWFVQNQNGLQPLTHLSGYICDKISLPVPAKQRVDGGVSFELNIRL